MAHGKEKQGSHKPSDFHRTDLMDDRLNTDAIQQIGDETATDENLHTLYEYLTNQAALTTVLLYDALKMSHRIGDMSREVAPCSHHA